MKKFDAKILAFYLPQYHPIKENNENFGEGFTEWTNVAKAKPLFRGHIQPKIPADLGFYDLRLPEVRAAQAEMAREAGVSAFCYYHYWFGDGKVVMEKPLQEVVRLGEPDFPFCVCWANHTWYKKTWDTKYNKLKQDLLFEQKYLGRADIIEQFNYLLPIFKDKRYYRIEDRLVFVVYDAKGPNDDSYWKLFKDIWNQLAIDNGLPEFYFITNTIYSTDVDLPCHKEFDMVILSLSTNVIYKQNFSILSKVKYRLNEFCCKILRRPHLLKTYKEAIPYFIHEKCKRENVIPTIVPNWDYTPRRGNGGLILHGSTPELFKTHIRQVFDVVAKKTIDNQVIFLKSWNEWGEGNYMEPDLQYGKQYIYALREVIDEYDSKYNKND